MGIRSIAAYVSAASFIPATAVAQSEPFQHEVVIRGDSAAERDRKRAFASSLAATTVSSETMRDETPQSLADAVRTAAPSVSIQQTTPGQGTVYVRGLSGRAVVYAIDGVRLNMAFFRAGNNDTLGLADPYSLSSIVVVPGAASVEYGSDALGGAVLMNTESPKLNQAAPATRYRAFQSFTSNPRGTASRVSVLHEGVATAAALGFTYFQAGAIRPGEGARSPDPASYRGLERAAGEPYRPLLGREQLGTEFEFYSTDATLLRRLGRGTDVVLKAQYSLRPELVRYDQVTPRFKSELPARAERSLSPMSRAMASATLRQRRTESWFDSGEIQFAWQRIYERRVDRRHGEQCVEDPALEPEDCQGTLRLLPENRRAFEENSSNAFTLRAEGRKANASKAVSMIWGADARHDIVSSKSETLDFATQATTSGDSRYPDGSSVSEGGLFAHARWRAAPGAHVFVGARASLFHIDMNGRDGEVSSAPFRRTVADAVGSVGLHWQFAPGLAWVVNGARGVRAPNIEDFAALGTRAQGRFQVPNPDVRPEHSYTTDTGFKLARGSHHAHTMLFFSRHGDAIALAPTSVGGQALTPDGDEYFHSINASSIDLYGAEAAFDVRATKALAAFGRALAMRGIQRNPAETGLPAETPADRAPPVQGEVGVRCWPFESLELEVFAVARAAQRRLNDPINLEDNRIPAGGTPGYTTYHARAKYRVDQALIARLAFDNLTDELALDHGSGFYRPGFSVSASVELALEPDVRVH